MTPVPSSSSPRNQIQPTRCHVIHRFTYFSCFVFIAFIIYIVQEFTFILNFENSVPSANTLEDYLLLSFSNSTLRKFPDKDVFRFYANGTDDWRQVTDYIYVFSAFWDTRLSNASLVRIIAGARFIEYKMNATKCLIKFNSSSTVLEVPAESEILTEHHGKIDKAIYLKCFLNTDESPAYVAVVPLSWDVTWASRAHFMKVHSLEHNTQSSRIGLCVRPMFNYTDVFRIAEFIAYYEAIGVSHFSFYIYDASEHIVSYFQEIQLKNYSIEILPWSLPGQLQHMWAKGQLASINDCIYRQMQSLMYVIVVDLDEFVTPRQVMHIQEVLEKQDIPTKHSASFVFRSCCFCAEYKQDILPSVILPFTTQISIRRESYIYPFLVRSKYIVKPSKTLVAGVHNVWKLIPGWEQRFVPASQVLVHHYRARMCVGPNKTLEEGVIDVKSRKYLNQLIMSRATTTLKHRFSNII